MHQVICKSSNFIMQSWRGSRVVLGRVVACVLAAAVSGAAAAKSDVEVSLYPGTAMELYKWAQQPGSLGGLSEAGECIVRSFAAAPRDYTVYSQHGEDGILEYIFGCIGPGGKRYVEFGTENGWECETRKLRELEGWSGLMMDGSHSNASIGLRRELIFEENIVALFTKYEVPQAPDLLVVDIDLNTFWVLAAIMRAGYRPRALSVEYNRNFHPAQAYATTYMPGEAWPGTCYFGASGLAYERLMRAFGYSMVAFDHAGVNLFFVADSELGGSLPHSFAAVTHVPSAPKFKPLFPSCAGTLWQHVAAAAPFSSPDLMALLQPVLLGTADTHSHPDKKLQARRMYEVALPQRLQSSPGCRAGLWESLESGHRAKERDAAGRPRPEQQQPSVSLYAGCGLGGSGGGGAAPAGAAKAAGAKAAPAGAAKAAGAKAAPAKAAASGAAGAPGKGGGKASAAAGVVKAIAGGGRGDGSAKAAASAGGEQKAGSGGGAAAAAGRSPGSERAGSGGAKPTKAAAEAQRKKRRKSHARHTAGVQAQGST